MLAPGVPRSGSTVAQLRPGVPRSGGPSRNRGLLSRTRAHRRTPQPSFGRPAIRATTRVDAVAGATVARMLAIAPCLPTLACAFPRKRLGARRATGLVVMTRTVPPALRRALDHRDRGCRFPGCGLRFCDAHHVTHWADGGATRLGNLVLLCRRHHRAAHDDGFRVEPEPGRGVTSYRPEDGSSPPRRPCRGCRIGRGRTSSPNTAAGVSCPTPSPPPPSGLARPSTSAWPSPPSEA